ncbi:MAG: DUF4124 domain-containing protein [Pseudomonadota bacterium]
MKQSAQLHGVGHAVARLAAVALAAVAGLDAAAQGIYTCTDSRGRKLTSDRPILECLDREQKVLNKDGSPRGVLPPSLTAEERAELEARERRREQERMALQDAIRRDKLLLSRYPNEKAHRKAREEALEDVRKSIQNSEQRIAELERERKPLLDEAEFYKGKQMPAKLKQSLEFVEVAVEAHRTLIRNQQAELSRINFLYDQELDRLRKLWAGAKPGSLPQPQATAQGEAPTKAP